jgi:hypothetical protein
VSISYKLLGSAGSGKDFGNPEASEEICALAAAMTNLRSRDKSLEADLNKSSWHEILGHL